MKSKLFLIAVLVSTVFGLNSAQLSSNELNFDFIDLAKIGSYTKDFALSLSDSSLEAIKKGAEHKLKNLPNDALGVAILDLKDAAINADLAAKINQELPRVYEIVQNIKPFIRDPETGLMLVTTLYTLMAGPMPQSIKNLYVSILALAKKVIESNNDQDIEAVTALKNIVAANNTLIEKLYKNRNNLSKGKFLTDINAFKSLFNDTNVEAIKGLIERNGKDLQDIFAKARAISQSDLESFSYSAPIDQPIDQFGTQLTGLKNVVESTFDQKDKDLQDISAKAVSQSDLEKINDIAPIDQSATGLTGSENTVESTFDQKDFERYQKNYAFLFRRAPENVKHALYDLLRTPTGKPDNAIDKAIAYFNMGGIPKNFETQDTETINSQKFNLKDLRKKLLSKLIELVASEEKLSVYDPGEGYTFFGGTINNEEKIMTGKREGGYTMVEDPVGHRRIVLENLLRFELPYRECINDKKLDCSEEKKDLDEFKRRLAQHYKIHLMPKEDDILKVTQILIKALKDNKEMRKLIQSFKIKSDLSLSYQDKDTTLPYPLIVVYHAEGKDEVQTLLDTLMVLFKGIKGLDIVPRYNLKVNDLIFYAQGDADYKKGDNLKYFDETKNYALYKDDFEDQKHEPYELKF